MQQFDVAIVGAGASGIIAAITISKENPNLRIALLEKNQRIGKKILATGNGRCNLTNLDQSENHYHGKNLWFIQQVLMQFDLDETLEFFRKIGVETVDEDGKVFPYSFQATSVLDLLRHQLSLLNIQEICEFSCTKIAKNGHSFVLSSSDGKVVRTNKVLISTGGMASPQTGSSGDGYRFLTELGHCQTDLAPALVQVRCEGKKTLPLKGIKVQAKVSALMDGILLRSESGEVLFTEYGLSGPPVFQLSRYASSAVQNKQPLTFLLDLFPEKSADELISLLQERQKRLPRELFLVGLLHKVIGREVLRELGEEAKELSKMAELLKAWPFQCCGTQGWAQAQVTSGGIALNDFSPFTLESKHTPGLYACGEVLDADGDCGGYNLQWAWSSGVVAGRAIAKG